MRGCYQNDKKTDGDMFKLTTGIAKSSVIAVDVGPRSLAHFATHQSREDLKG